MTNEESKEAMNDVVTAVLRKVEMLNYDSELSAKERLVKAYRMVAFLIERLGLSVDPQNGEGDE